MSSAGRPGDCGIQKLCVSVGVTCQRRDFSRRFGKMTTIGHLWVESRVHGTKDHLQSPSEREPGKMRRDSRPGPKAMETAEEVDFIQRAVGRSGGVLRREIYEQVPTSENSS